VLVADRKTKAQNPKIKKLASEPWEMLWNLSVIEDFSQCSISRCSNSFSFLTAFAPPFFGHQQGSFPKV
jgi:hypothetical protein